MIKKLPFLNADWFWPVISIAVAIWLIFVWKEKSKYPSITFFIHSLIGFITCCSLCLIVLKPLTHASKKPFQTAIITDGYDNNQLDSLKKVFPDLITHKYNPNKSILNKTSIPESVFVVGHGIKPYDLWQLDSVETTYIGGDELKGVTHVNYNTNNTIGKRVIFKGRYLNAQTGNRLVLKSPSGKSIDSVFLSSKKKQDFELSASLNTKGNFLYHLIEKDSTEKNINKNPLPITVNNQASLKILVINDFPTFETKYLKNYLAEKGHEVLIRSQLTKDKYKYEYFNMSKRLTVSLNKKNLKAYDLLIIDSNSLNKLSRNNLNSIKKAIQEDGLGVFIQVDQNFYSSNNKLTSFAFRRDKNNTVALKNWPRTKIKTYPFKFKSEFSIQPIETSDTKTISAYKNMGNGRIGTTLALNSYELKLNGNPEVYQELWSKILENLSKKEALTADWSVSSFPLFPNEPMNFILRTKIENPQVLVSESAKIPLQQDVDITSLWEGTTYPKQTGWETLKIEQDSSLILNYYVQDSIHWKTLKAHQTIIKNKQHFNGNSQIKKGTPKSAVPINLIWFYIPFLLSIGYLWLEPKL